MRLFVALDLPANVRTSLADLIARLKSVSQKTRWVRAEGMHVTLKFIGEIDPVKLDSIRAALRTVHSDKPVDINIRGVGFFPNERRPRVAWCGVEASENLAQLAAGAERALEAVGVRAEKRPYKPHLTLARFSSPDGLEKLFSAANDLKSHEFGSARETEFHLYESILKPSGAEYKRLASYPFVAKITEKIAKETA